MYVLLERCACHPPCTGSSRITECRPLLGEESYSFDEQSAILDAESPSKIHRQERANNYESRPVRSFEAQQAGPPPRLLVALACFGIAGSIALAKTMSSLVMAGSHRQAAFVMSFGAGMATGIGALLVLCTRSLDRSLLAATMSFSAGVMLYVSLVEVVAVANEHFASAAPASWAYAYATASFFLGVIVMALVDRCVHLVFDSVIGHGSHRLDAACSMVSKRGDHSSRNCEESVRCIATTTSADEHSYEACDASYDGEGLEDESGLSIRTVAAVEERSRLLMMAAVVSTAIVLHNLPEGMATYVASFHSISAGAPLAIAIAIHNIPEGLAIAMPVFYATRSRTKAVGLGALSGMSEPLGAVIASLVANEHSSKSAFGFMFGLTGGMMAYVCIAELLPAAFREKGVDPALVTRAFFFGCLTMALSLVLERFAAE